jgi:acetoin utilization deacetylase AcuC-like enzyme
MACNNNGRLVIASLRRSDYVKCSIVPQISGLKLTIKGTGKYKIKQHVLVSACIGFGSEKKCFDLDLPTFGVYLMKVVFTERHRIHNPKTFIVRGRVVSNPETPARADVLLAAARAANHTLVETSHQAADELNVIHTSRYLAFLEHAFQDWCKLPGASDEMIPNTHPNRFAARYADHVVARAGFHLADTACPITSGTWKAARASIDVAITVGDLILNGERAAYGLCRPPGHHACSDMGWGFCYLNNIAVLAETLRKKGAERLAILDLDIHHGNGTQQIFYDRRDVLFVSVHADPDRFPPFYSGYSDEIGTGQGEGFNRNLPLPHHADDDTFIEAIRSTISSVNQYGPDVLLVSLGLDTYRGDPFSVFDVTTEGLLRAGALVAAVRKPTAILQEGGYPSSELGDNLVAFLAGFAD